MKSYISGKIAVECGLLRFTTKVLDRLQTAFQIFMASEHFSFQKFAFFWALQHCKKEERKKKLGLLSNSPFSFSISKEKA